MSSPELNAKNTEIQFLKTKLKRLDQEVQILRKKLANSNKSDADQATSTDGSPNNNNEATSDDLEASRMNENELTELDFDMDDMKLTIDDIDFKNFDILKMKNDEMEQIKRDYEQQIEAVTLKVSLILVYIYVNFKNE